MKTLFLLLISLIISYSLKSQPACYIEYSYQGKIIKKHAKDSSPFFLKFPSAAHLIGFKGKFFPQKVILKTDSCSFQSKHQSLGVSRFCASKENLVKNIFRKHKVYKVVLIYKGRRKVYKINVKDIIFQWNDSTLEIKLPNLHF